MNLCLYFLYVDDNKYSLYWFVDILSSISIFTGFKFAALIIPVKFYY